MDGSEVDDAAFADANEGFWDTDNSFGTIQNVDDGAYADVFRTSPSRRSSRKRNFPLYSSGTGDEDSNEFDHIGDASASLGIVGTLVMAVALDKLLYVDTKPAATLLLALSSAFSAYALTFSVLEFYYVKALLAAKSRSERKLRSAMTSDEGGPPKRAANIDFISRLEAKSAKFAKLEAKFASLSLHRLAARDSMWMSLLCMFSATITLRSDGLDHYFSTMSSSMTALATLLWFDFLLVGGWCILGGRLFWQTLILAAACTSVFAVDALHYRSELATIEAMIVFVMLISMAIVLRVVLKFRQTFVPMLISTTDII